MYFITTPIPSAKYCVFVMVQHTYLDQPHCFLIFLTLFFLHKNMFHLSGWIGSYIYGALLFFYAGVYCIRNVRMYKSKINGPTNPH